MALLTNEWILLPLIGGLTFIVSYLWADRIYNFLHEKSLGQIEEIQKTLGMVYITIEKKRLAILILLANYGLGVLFFLLLWPRIFMGGFIAAILVMVGWRIPKRFVDNLFEKRCSKIIAQMPDAMTIMANGVSSGLGVSQSIRRVADNMKNPISQEFRMILQQTEVGASLDQALLEFAERVPRPDIQMFVTATNILTETGGRLEETFQTIVETIRERQKVQKKIEALTAQGMMQGIIVTLVPFIMLGVFLVMDPNYVMPLFTTTFGLICLFLMVTLQILGGLAIRKIVKVDV